MKIIQEGYIVEVTETFSNMFSGEVKKGTVAVVIKKNSGYSSGWWHKTYHPATAVILTEKKTTHTVPTKMLRIKTEVKQSRAINLQELRREHEKEQIVAFRPSRRVRPRFSHSGNSR